MVSNFLLKPHGDLGSKIPVGRYPHGQNQCLKLMDKLTCFYILICMLNN